jgi:hypothetical protein
MGDKKTETVAEIFIEKIICQHGCPLEVVSDNGKEFKSETFQKLEKIYGFKHLFTTTYRPQSNGQVERQNKTIANMLSGYVNELGNNWDSFLSMCTFAYNNSVQESTKFTPFFVNHLRHPLLPIDITLGFRNKVFYNIDSPEANVHMIKNVWKMVEMNLKKSQEKQERVGNEINKAREHEFGEQELVLIKNERRNNKFSSLWVGPFQIEEIRRPNLIIKALDGKKKLVTIHMNKAKKFIAPYTLPLRSKDTDLEVIDPNTEENAEIKAIGNGWASIEVGKKDMGHSVILS